MDLITMFLNEMDHEFPVTRKVLERIPTEKFAWTAHPRSWPIGHLAAHVANIPSWIALALTSTSFDMHPAGQPPARTPHLASSEEVLAMFDHHVEGARDTLRRTDPDNLQLTWTLLAGGNPVLTIPRTAVLRSFVLNHMIHHRGQLAVYLRLLDLPVPSIYGPSADEK